MSPLSTYSYINLCLIEEALGAGLSDQREKPTGYPVHSDHDLFVLTGVPSISASADSCFVVAIVTEASSAHLSQLSDNQLTLSHALSFCSFRSSPTYLPNCHP